MTDVDTLHGIDFADVVTGRAEHSYLIKYNVAASTALEAVERAVVGLRKDVHLVGLNYAEPAGGDRWDVSLKVWESCDD